MKITALIMFAFFTISFAYSHPNHMSFEEVKHDNEQIHNTSPEPEKMAHRAMEEKSGHSNTIPCTIQHKAMPCKKK